MRSYHSASPQGLGGDVKALINKVLTSGAPQWYCDEQTAMRALRRVERGDVAGFRPLVRQKYEDMLKRVRVLEGEGLGRQEAVAAVISSPAPRYYFGLRTAYRIIRWQRKSRYKQGR